MMDLETLLRAVRDRQPGAWKRLGPRLSAELRQYFRRWFHDQDAKDRAQDTIAIVFSKLPGFEPTVSLRAWVLGIASNLVNDAFRAQYRQKLLTEAMGWVLPTPSMGLSYRFRWLEEHRILMEEVQRLPARLRGIVEHDLAGGDAGSFAKEHGITVETVRTRRHRGLKLLKTRLEARISRRPLPQLALVVDTPGTPPSG